MTKLNRIGEKKTRSLSLGIYPADRELMAWGAEFLGCSQSEFVRTAIRVYTAQLQTISKQLR